MSIQYDPTRVGQQAQVLGGVHTSAGLARLYLNVAAGSVAYTSDLGPVMNSGGGWLASSTVAGRVSGATFDGVTDDSAAFAAALTAIGSTAAALSIAGPMVVNANTTVPANVQLIFTGRGLIKPGANKTVTINGPINAGPWQIFDVSNSGAVVTGAIKNAFCYADWFGAIADGVTDSTVGLQAIAKLAADAGYLKVYMTAGTYKVTATVYANGANSQSFYAPTWIGVEKYQGTIIDGSSLGSSVPIFKFRGSSGRFTGGYMENIQFLGSGSTIGTMVQGLGGYQIRRCRYDNHTTGHQWHNEDASSFTEYVTLDGCDFRANVTTPYDWKVTSGTSSFHGSGPTNRNTVNASATGPVAHIGVGANIYNCPFNAQVWSTTGAITIIQNDNTVAPTPAGFVGELSLEISTSFVTTLGGNKAVYFAGPIRANGETTASGDNLVAGTLLRVETMTVHADSSYSFTGARANTKIVPSSGTNTNNTLLVSSQMKGATRQVNVYIKQSSNYHKRYQLYAEAFGSATAVNPTTVVTGNSVDSLTIGSPTFTGNTDGSFNIVAPTTALTFTGSFSGGETSGTLNANWVHGTGVFSVTFSNADKRQVTLTNAATTADWSTGGGALSGVATTAATASNYSSSALIYVAEQQVSSGLPDGGHIQY